ncbi:MAG: thiamine pyrophosphate-dependent enzyme [Paracoccaceae bacterium]|nr:thiamine pyrophosphate-dependent enzyme [Paracoccaceae bacterium]
MSGSNLIKRRELVAALLERREGALVVPGLGSPTWDCFAAGGSDDYLYSWGGMGLAVPTALGVALARPGRRVLCLTGDGEMLMGIGSLAVVAAQVPANLGILVLDNESFGETGRQSGLTGIRADLCGIARGAGIGETFEVTSMDQLDDLAGLMFSRPGPTFAVAKIALTDEPWALPEKDGAVIARTFRKAADG